MKKNIFPFFFFFFLTNKLERQMFVFNDRICKKKKGFLERLVCNGHKIFIHINLMFFLTYITIKHKIYTWRQIKSFQAPKYIFKNLIELGEVAGI
jgi:hypothetical protein